MGSIENSPRDPAAGEAPAGDDSAALKLGALIVSMALGRLERPEALKDLEPNRRLRERAGVRNNGELQVKMREARDAIFRAADKESGEHEETDMEHGSHE